MNFKNVTYEKGIQGMLYCDKSQLKGVVVGTANSLYSMPRVPYCFNNLL